ncbi:MAG: MoxR family ATPase [Oscillospiraceae bacterium]|nr:MoxR family ATPase [Oscillospiraceae bacterium]
MEKIIHLNKEIPAEAPLTEQEAGEARERVAGIVSNIETVIRGKHEQVELTVLCLLAEGHALIEDIPGVGKTSLVNALSKTIACGSKRIQFTPDVMPSDISGYSIYNQKSGEFEFRPGAAMSNIVLADEINRASAKTQSALLEIMEERQVTVDGQTYLLTPPFMVLATQNPIDSLGTYQLPEAQIDRFMVKFSLGYPAFEDEVNVLMAGRQAKREIGSVVTAEQVCTLISQCGRVYVSREVSAYIVRIVEATRNHAEIRLGASPRGSIALHAMARAAALGAGRDYVLPDDVKRMAPYVLAHRLILTHKARTEKRDERELIRSIVERVVVPVGAEGRK